MSFTYSLSTDVGKVRMRLGDTVSGSGVRPGGTNLTDEEITLLLTEADDDVARAVAAGCALLANAWAVHCSITVGPQRREFSDVAERWAKRAQELGGQFWGVGVTSVALARADGYAEAAA